MTDFDALPELSEPILIGAFEGWNDAADAATTAVEHLELTWDAKPLAALDPDDYYDFQVNRPSVALVDGVLRRLEWPTTRFSVCRPEGSEHDLVLMRGPEPNMRWRSFCDEILEICVELEIRTVVLLGAMLADIPHTRPVSVAGSAYDASSAARFGLTATNYRGATGVVTAMQDACIRSGLETLAFWAAIPHYVSQPPNPKATLALLHRVEEVLDVPIPLGNLPEQADEWQSLVDTMAQEDEEVTEYVRSLEEKAKEADLSQTTGESIAREFERYLRRRSFGSGD